MIYASCPRTYSIKKARERLEHKPLDDRDEQIQRCLEWARPFAQGGSIDWCLSKATVSLSLTAECSSP